MQQQQQQQPFNQAPHYCQRTEQRPDRNFIFIATVIFYGEFNKVIIYTVLSDTLTATRMLEKGCTKVGNSMMGMM